MARRRFGPDYVKDDIRITPQSLPEHLAEGFRTYYAELSNEQKDWNQQWYSEDHNDTRRQQRHFFLAFLQHVRPAVVHTLYQLMPPFKQIFANQTDPLYTRFHSIQSAVMSYSAQYLEIDEVRREELDTIIEAKLAAKVKRQAPAPRQPSAPLSDRDSEWQFMILQQVEFQTMQRFVKEDAPDVEEEINERFMVIYGPLYRWMSRWNLLAPWVADVVLSTLLDWDRRGTTQQHAQQFTLIPRPKRAVHNTVAPRLPKLAPEDFRFEFAYQADWDLESVHFCDFQERHLQAAQEALSAFKCHIDNKMLEAGYKQVTGSTNVQDLEPFRWLTRYQVDKLSFEQIAEEELERREKEARDNLDLANDTDSTKVERDRLIKLSNLDDSIERATQRLAGRIGLNLRGTNQN